MSVTPCIYKDRLWGDPMSHPFIEGHPCRTHGNHDWQQNARHDVDHSNLLPAAGSVSRKVSRKPPYNTHETHTHTHTKKEDRGGFWVGKNINENKRHAEKNDMYHINIYI